MGANRPSGPKPNAMPSSSNKTATKATASKAKPQPRPHHQHRDNKPQARAAATAGQTSPTPTRATHTLSALPQHTATFYSLTARATFVAAIPSPSQNTCQRNLLSQPHATTTTTTTSKRRIGTCVTSSAVTYNHVQQLVTRILTSYHTPLPPDHHNNDVIFIDSQESEQQPATTATTNLPHGPQLPQPLPHLPKQANTTAAIATAGQPTQTVPMRTTRAHQPHPPGDLLREATIKPEW